MAFEALELRGISHFSDDSPEAQSAGLHYDDAMGVCLEEAEWSFANVVVALPSAAPTAELFVDPDLPYAYQMPSDTVTLRQVWPKWARYRVDSDALRSDQPAPLQVRYTRLVQDERKLPATFRALVAYELAVRLSPRYAKSSKQIERLVAMRAEALDRALRGDRMTASQQRYDGRDDCASDDDWVTGAMQ